jgi:hypothetical protein
MASNGHTRGEGVRTADYMYGRMRLLVPESQVNHVQLHHKYHLAARARNGVALTL